MKKYLMSGVAAIAFLAAFTSCSKSTDLYDQGAIDEKNKQELENKVDLAKAEYKTAFEKTFGTIQKGHMWGFGKKTAWTRGHNANGNDWAKDGYTVPGEITSQELDAVLAVFNQEGEETYEALVDWDCFFVQQVYTGKDNKYYDGAGQEVYGAEKMNWLCAYDPVGETKIIYPDWNNWQPTEVTDHDDHVNDFNAATSNDYGGRMLMVNSSTRRFGYSSSQDNGHVFYYFRMEQINGNYYVGFDFSAEGQNPNEQVQRDYIYNDWIVKIVPGKGTSKQIKEEGRIICEDLGTADDFDFNDIVFDATIYTDNTCDIEILAAGGILDVSVAGQAIHPAVPTMTTKCSYKFTVDNISSLEAIPIVVTQTGSAGLATSYELAATPGDAPQKIRVAKTYKWCTERTNIEDAHPGFKEWVSDETKDAWMNNYVNGKVVE